MCLLCKGWSLEQATLMPSSFNLLPLLPEELIAYILWCEEGFETDHESFYPCTNHMGYVACLA
jgi:hypothetical protein